MSTWQRNQLYNNFTHSSELILNLSSSIAESLSELLKQRDLVQLSVWWSAGKNHSSDKHYRLHILGQLRKSWDSCKFSEVVDLGIADLSMSKVT